MYAYSSRKNEPGDNWQLSSIGVEVESSVNNPISFWIGLILALFVFF